MSTATEKFMEDSSRIDFRKKRAAHLASVLVREIEDVLPHDTHDALRDIHDRIFEMLYLNGAAWTTDEERRALGFEERDLLGWTPSERIKHQQQILEFMTKLQHPIVEIPQ